MGFLCVTVTVNCVYIDSTAILPATFLSLPGAFMGAFFAQQIIMPISLYVQYLPSGHRKAFQSSPYQNLKVILWKGNKCLETTVAD